MTKRIHRTYRTMTEEEQKEKFGFSQMDLIKEKAWFAPPFNELFQRESLIAEDKIVDEMVR